MRVLHLCKYDFRTHNGGIESVCKSMYEYFKAAINGDSSQFHYFLFFSANATSLEYKEENFHFYIAGINKQIGSTPVSLQYIKKYTELRNAFDIVHIHVPNPVALFAVYYNPPKAQIVVHWHSDIVKQKFIYPYFKFIERKVLALAAAVIATSENYIEGSKPLMSCRDKIKVIPIGIAPLKALTKQTGNNKDLILSIGRLVYYKGFEYLIKAAQYLDDNCHIVIVGNGNLYEKLKELTVSLNVLDKVELAGNISDEQLNELMSRCKVFCLPSIERSEAFGVVLLEALSIGKPIVATNIPYSGVNWVNKHNVTGYNVAPKNEQQLAGAITDVLSDQQLYKELSFNASERFKNLFTAERMNKSIYALYVHLISK